MNNKQSSSFIESYEITLNIAGKYSKLLKKSFLYFILAYIFQGLAFSFLFPLLNNIFSSQTDFKTTVFWLCVIIFASLVSFVFRWMGSDFQYSKELIEITHDLRVKLGKKLKLIPLQNLYRYRTGKLNAILSQNVDESILHMGVVAGMLFEVIIIPIIIIIATCFINPSMALSLLISFPFAIYIYKWSRKQTRLDKTDEVEAHSTLESDTIEYVQGLTILRAVNKVGKNAQSLQKSILTLKEIQKKSVYNSIIPMILMSTLIEFVFLFILSVGSIWIVSGELTVGGLLALLIILGRLSEPLSLFLGVTSILDLMESSFKNIQKLLGTKELFLKKPLLKVQKFNIQFDEVTFNYDNSEKKSLDNLSIEIPEKSLTAIVGSSGSGKTTISKLIMRYADPQNGVVKIGGIDVRSISPITLMSYISVVFQDIYLFDDTIFNNIRMGKSSATKEEIIKASKAAFCHDFISQLPHGYDTKVGEIGGSLSGGERQRISIARAILKDTPIVILDEPTSSLDIESELIVQSALDELIKDKTVIVIAHRLSTITHADSILVIENGKLQESGTHSKLLEKKGLYSSMLCAQRRTKEWNITSSTR